MIGRFPVVLLAAALLLTPPPAHAGQVCGCQKVSTGRINRITAIPPGVPPTCKAPKFDLLCWPDQASSGSVTSITAGSGLDATPNPITGVGTISVDAPTCSAATEKLQWDGSSFQCGVESTAPDIGVGIQNSGVAVTSGPYFTVPFTSEDWDTANMHDAGAPGDLVAPVAGRYLISAVVLFGETASPTDPNFNLRELIIFKSGGGSFGQVLTNATTSSPVEETGLSTSAILKLAAGEVVHVVVTQSSGGPLNLTAQAQMQKLS